MKPCTGLTVTLLLLAVASGAGAQTSTASSAPAVGPVTPATPAIPPAPTSPLVDPSDYRIGPEDVLQISVWKNEALSRTVPVRPDGKITLPLLNDVEAAGYTPMEFRDVLVAKLTEYMPSPEVSVIVTEPRSFKVSVIGEVGKAGRYELRSRTTVLDLLAMVGGLNQFASRSKIYVLRQTDKGQQTRIPFNYNKALNASGEQENFFLQPGDIIVVP